MINNLNINEESPPDVVNDSDRIILMRDRFIRIKESYESMLYFCQRITGIQDLSVSTLRDFDFARFHTSEAFKKNMSFPVSSYLDKIRELESELSELKNKVDNETVSK